MVAKELNQRGCLTKSWTGKKGNVHAGGPWNTTHIYRTLANHKYVGEIAHKGNVHPAEHPPIIDRRAWDRVQGMLTEKGRVRGSNTRRKTPALLKGLIRCGHCGKAMGITFAQRHGKQYRYYLCGRAAKNGYDSCPVRTVAAGVVEAAVMEQLKAVFASPEMIARTYRAAAGRAKIDPVLAGQPEPPTEAEVADSLRDIDPVWNELFPREQERIVKLLVERVVVFENRIEVLFRSAGLHSLVAEMGQAANEEAKEVAE
jgi:site-specific DNA recombinase